MKKAIAHVYDYHREYDVALDAALLNTKIRIYGAEYAQTGDAYYEGSIGKFIRERIPSDVIVELLPLLKNEKKVTYRLGNSENYIERI